MTIASPRDTYLQRNARMDARQLAELLRRIALLEKELDSHRASMDFLVQAMISDLRLHKPSTDELMRITKDLDPKVAEIIAENL